MKLKGSNSLRWGAILEIIVGVVSMIFIRMLLGENETLPLLSNDVAHDALLGLVYIYVANGFKILAGIIGVFAANKKSMLLVIIGLLLFVAQGFAFVHTDQTIPQLIINILSIVPAYLYTVGAIKNLKG